MVIRVVRMVFRPDALAAFEAIFHESQPYIAAFEGCRGVTLHHDAADPRVRYTHSHWNSLADLERYRQSELFANTWAKTKILFDDRPQAFSLLSLPQ
jgi:quinol monooxygenase YgiN